MSLQYISICPVNLSIFRLSSIYISIYLSVSMYLSLLSCHACREDFFTGSGELSGRCESVARHFFLDCSQHPSQKREEVARLVFWVAGELAILTLDTWCTSGLFLKLFSVSLFFLLVEAKETGSASALRWILPRVTPRRNVSKYVHRGRLL